MSSFATEIQVVTMMVDLAVVLVALRFSVHGLSSTNHRFRVFHRADEFRNDLRKSLMDVDNEQFAK